MYYKKKIAIFIMSKSLSGAEKRFIRIAFDLNRKRDDILLIVNSNLYDLGLKDQEIANKLKPLMNEKVLKIINTNKNSKYFRSLFTIRRLIQLIIQENIGTMHSALGALSYSIIGKLLGVKVIAEITSPDIANEVHTKYKRIISHFNKIISVSPGVDLKVRNNLNKINKLKETQLYCSPIPFFSPDNIENENDISKKKENLIVYASRFIERKNPILFAKSVKKLLSEKSDWNVVILGKGPLEKEINDILQSEIDDNRVIIEYSKDIYSYLRKSKIFVSLIYPDNYPSQSILEAMYMKNAIIATNVGNTDKFVTSKNGYMINEYSVESVYNNLKLATTHENELTLKGDYSYKMIKECFSKELYIEDLEKLYLNLN
ncbi:glycosyltransferase [Bacillus sp. JCM 19034]|uniref:glycosyltransferase n=1 Tax=Bacillus sp. JCM 19034 TaxID=1481928 RepID=UPI0007841E13|nr:glycosyltransferase [Bacillus sp. JCM 19034]